jgi:predicted nucleic acid-binding protein
VSCEFLQLLVRCLQVERLRVEIAADPFQLFLPEIGITVITRIEILRGFVMKAANRAELLRAQKLLVQTEAFLACLLVVSLDGAAASQSAIAKPIMRISGRQTPFYTARLPMVIPNQPLCHPEIPGRRPAA